MAALTIWKPQFSFTGTEQTVTALPGGGFALAYLGSNGLTYRTFDSAGAAVIVDRVVLAEFARQPTVSTTGDGRPVVFGYDALHASGEILVLNDAGYPVASVAVSMPSGGQVVDVQPLPGGRFLVAYSAQIADEPTSINIYIQICDFNGAAATVPIRVNQTVPGAQLQPSIAILADGGFVVTWRDASLGPQARVFEADGTARTAEMNLPEAVSTGNFPPETAALADGGFVVAWWSANVAYAQRYDADGVAVGTAIAVGQSNVAAAIFGSPIAVLGLQDGGFVVATTTYGLDDIGRVWLQRYDADGAPLDGPLEVLQSEDGTGRRLVTPSLALMADGRIVVSASDEDRVLDRVAIVDPRDSGVSLTGTSGADTYWGSAFADSMMGGSGADTMNGAEGDDRLDGGFGADTLSGGAGDDTYVVDNAGDLIVEVAGEGIDTVETARASYTLPGEVENLIGTWTRSQVLTGNGLDNRITGGVADDQLNGGGGSDRLDGGLGADVMAGGTGDDTYIVDEAGDQVVEAAGEGSDRVRAGVSWGLADGIEHLQLTGTSNLDGTGNAAANQIDGNAGANVLRGGGGADLIKGHGGADSLDGEAGADQLLGGDGNDILTGGADADRLQGEAGADHLYGGLGADLLEGGGEADTLYGEDGADQLYGDAGADILYGGAENDRLDGGAGADRMEGGIGDDNYFVDNVMDVIVENAGEGMDTVRASIGWTLGENLERLALEGATGLNGTGNGLANFIVGNGAANTLMGLGGADQLQGGAGDDLLDGGAGADMLTGGAGRDVFRFGADAVHATSRGGAADVDLVTDLDFASGDRVDLSAIDADIDTFGDQAFGFVSAFSGAAGQAVLTYVAASGSSLLQLDIDGDGVADLQVRFTGDVTGGLVLGGSEPAGTGGWLL